MKIEANKNKTDYALFLENDINRDRKIKLYENDSEEELIKKWKQEPLNIKSQQKVWDLFPNTTLSKVIWLVHRFDERLNIKTIADIYIMQAIPQVIFPFEKVKDGRGEGELYQWHKEEMYEEMYYLRMKIIQLENEVRTLNNALCAMSEAVYNE